MLPTVHRKVNSSHEAFQALKNTAFDLGGEGLEALERGFSVMLFDGIFCLFSLSRADCKFGEGAYTPI